MAAAGLEMESNVDSIDQEWSEKLLRSQAGAQAKAKTSPAKRTGGDVPELDTPPSSKKAKSKARAKATAKFRMCRGCRCASQRWSARQISMAAGNASVP